MKKILLAVMAVAAIGFTSCGNKTQQADAETAAVDSVAIVDSIAQGAAQETIAWRASRSRLPRLSRTILRWLRSM